jgi:hypothetical protein
MRDIGVGFCIGPIDPPLIAAHLCQFQRLFIVFKYFCDLINFK